MTGWSPERQLRYERASRQGTLTWRCLLCRRAIESEECPHSLAEHRVAVNECCTIALTQRSASR